MRIYFDVCCYNRPFDDLSQDRVRLEAEAVKAIMLRIGRRQWVGVSSPVVELEISQMSDPDRFIEVSLMVGGMNETVELYENDRARAKNLERLGLSAFDAAHLACAEKAQVDVFLTTDEKILKVAARSRNKLKVKVENPLKWFESMVKE
jgi:predicted nucleic acid-binding protein